MNWVSIVVEDLCEHKRRGATFYAAWQTVMEDWPPLTRDRPPELACLFDVGEHEPFLDAFYRACDDAWHGRRPHLRHLLVLLEAGDLYLNSGPLELAA